MLDIEQCWLTTDLGNEVRLAAREWAREAGLAAYDQADQTGYLRHLVYREGRNTGQVLVQLVTAPGPLHDADGLVAALRRFPEVRSIHHAVNDTPAEVTNLPTTLLWGEEAIEEELLGQRFRIRPTAFLQTNTAMAEQLYGLAIEDAGVTGTRRSRTSTAGSGRSGSRMARNALTVWGVDISEESVACALENADLNGIVNAAFFAGDVGQSIEELLDRSGAPDVVVVDPPRAGLSTRRRGGSGASAPPGSSTSRATRRPWRGTSSSSRGFGYQLRRIRPVDMFPHTPHVESVSLLERARSARRLTGRRSASHVPVTVTETRLSRAFGAKV